MLTSIFIYLFDDYSKWSWVYFLQSKSEAFQHFQNFHALLERKIGWKLNTMTSNQGGKFSSLEFQKYCEGFGIKRKFTAPNTP